MSAGLPLWRGENVYRTAQLRLLVPHYFDCSVRKPILPARQRRPFPVELDQLALEELAKSRKCA